MQELPLVQPDVPSTATDPFCFARQQFCTHRNPCPTLPLPQRFPPHSIPKNFPDKFAPMSWVGTKPSVPSVPCAPCAPGRRSPRGHIWSCSCCCFQGYGRREGDDSANVSIAYSGNRAESSRTFPARSLAPSRRWSAPCKSQLSSWQAAAKPLPAPPLPRDAPLGLFSARRGESAAFVERD